MSKYHHWAVTLILWVAFFVVMPVAAQEEEALLVASINGRNMGQATERLIQSINGNNFTFVRFQEIDDRLVPPDWEAKSVRIIYFCNFELMSRALALDTRASEFLPCRITLIETAHGVDLIAVNPAWVSNRLSNHRLHEYCMQMKRDYQTIMEEAAL